MLVVAVSRFAEFAGSGFHHCSGGSVIAKVKAGGAAILRSAIQDAVIHFVGRDRSAPAGGHPAVAPSKHAQKARAALVDDFAADFRGIQLVGNAPAQVHIHEMNPAREQLLAQTRKDKAHQVVALRLHVAERRGDEYANGFPSCRHLILQGRINFDTARVNSSNIKQVKKDFLFSAQPLRLIDGLK